MPSYSAKHNILCYKRNELISMHKLVRKNEMIAEMLKRHVSFDDIRSDHKKMDQIINVIVNRFAHDRDEHEIFYPLFSLIDFFDDKSELCFRMKVGFNPRKDKVITLNDLIKYRAGDDDSDFVIKTSEGFMFFQMKRYRGNLNADDIFKFVKGKVQHYANNLGATNLLILLQAQAYTKINIDFHKLYDSVNSMKYNFDGKILLKWNEMNRKNVIVQVYPTLIKQEIPFEFPSSKLKRWHS